MTRHTASEPYEAALTAALHPGERVIWHGKGSGIHIHPFFILFLGINAIILFGNTINALYFPDWRHMPMPVAIAVCATLSALAFYGMLMPNFTHYVVTTQRAFSVSPNPLTGFKPGLNHDRPRDQITAIELRAGLVTPRLVLQPYKNRQRDLQDLVGIPDPEATGLKLAQDLSVPFSRSNGFTQKPVFTPEKGDLI